MFLITSMTQVSILIAVTVYILLVIALGFSPLKPFRAAGVFVKELSSRKKMLLHFCAVLMILFFNKIEQLIEKQMHHLSDFTPSFHQMEGEFIVVFQKLFENIILTHFMSYYYVVVFTALMVASIILYVYTKNTKLFYALCYAIMFNYMIAIPFFLFFPVTEVHAFNPNVRFLMLDAFPTFEAEYRPLSGLNNCFPSLHTSLSVTLALMARRSGNAFWKWFVPISAAIIIFSIFYLGIHWLTDMVGGMTLGFFSSLLALRLAEGRQIMGQINPASNRLKKRDWR
ncbi:phosphatase PAP2 family protein [Paenibacillus koleovorans]|uniref:phosphatase PAP2 family protein n=1 Tax=Paenibacillus koleovorans TaxID=121608 RepID=UPI000FD822D8|nr:phosphatase PAP2 family protein [Paenibacillus koleovorans]